MKTFFASGATASASLAALAAAGAPGVLYMALACSACEEVTSVIELSEGTEIPELHAPRLRAKRFQSARGDEDAAAGGDTHAADSGSPVDASTLAADSDDADAEVKEPAGTLGMDVSSSCPVQISLHTVSYGNGDEAQEDFAPNNVGAIWITKREGDKLLFVRSVVAWGPTYFDQALTWIDQTRGNLVDTVTLPTRPGHKRAVEASWDCRDTMQQLVAAGTYLVNFEFTEVESQGPVLTGERALAIELGDKPSEVVRAPQGYFGEIRVTAGMP